MANFQFDLLLSQSGLSPESVHMLRSVFSVLTDERRIELMDHWPKHLDRFLAIERKGMEERKENIRLALSRIESIIDDALAKERAQAKLEAEKSAQAQENLA